ncbi:MAG: anhydro-N-acetylmuramic acid kinase, partial [Succinivibrio sp.]|nr:anhydro-N-acetylmuramic acid kinase [Succinivibrio sp.]
MQELYIGLMSGTSIDGIDAVLCTFNQGKSEILESTSVDYDKDTKALLHSLCQSSYDEIEKLGVAKVKLATFEAQAVNELLLKAKVEKEDIVAIGSHGQTIRHRPEKGFSIQLDDGALLAALTGIDVICDFRSADIAHGGNGAPLTQAFHKMQFQDPTKV